jgi:hypothetical protein
VVRRLHTAAARAARRIKLSRCSRHCIKLLLLLLAGSSDTTL